MTIRALRSRGNRAACLALAAMMAAAPTALVAADQPAILSEFHTYDLGRNDIGRPDADHWITRAQAVEDLDALSDAIRTNSSYIWATTFPHERAINAIKAKLPARVSVNGLSTQIDRLVRLFGDDHAQVVGWADRVPQGFAPFRVGKQDSRYFLFTNAPAGFANPDFPYVRSIDGVLIEEWQRVAGDLGQGPVSSPAARFARGYVLMEYINHLRTEMKLPLAPEIEVELVSDDGNRTMRIRFPVVAARETGPRVFHLPERSRMLAGNIGYLRVPAHRGELADAFLADLDRAMTEFRGTHALIIDARQSGGGQRKVLNALFPYFMPPASKPYIYNLAKIRIPAGRTDFDPKTSFDDPAKRMHYVPDAAVPQAEADAYRALSAHFQPSWTPPADKFTDWFFAVQRPDPKKPYYGKPVYLLTDWGLGSAGDIFTSAFKGWPGITLVGTATMGRSGQGVEFPLPNSKLEVNLSTMASFQKTGERYDTVGIAPDIAMDPAPTDWFGASDTVLERVRKMALSGPRTR